MQAEISSPGKALIVGATREICARLYDEIIALRPDWHDDAVDKGTIKVVYSGSAQDPEVLAKHVRRESQNKVIRQRLENPDDELQLVIVQNMLLTGFDAPPLHTLYLDRGLKGASLMQTLARVNRTFRGKTAGLLVAYAPLVENLSQALAEYTVDDQQTKPVGKNIDEAVALTMQLVAQLDQLCAGYPWEARTRQDRHGWLAAAQGLTDHLRSPAPPGTENRADRFRTLANQLGRAWSLCSGTDALEPIRPKIKFYEQVRVWMAKYDAAERQAEGRPAGMAKPSLDDLGPEFEVRVRNTANPHLAIEALRGVLIEETRKATRNNVVRERAFSERVTELMRRYTNQQLTAAEVIARLIELAREVAAEGHRGASFTPPLSEHELAFYDAVAENESAVREQGSDVLAQIARELVEVMRRDAKTDWTVREDLRVKLRSSIKRLLAQHKYPPDKRPEAIRLVIEQMEVLAPQFARPQ